MPLEIRHVAFVQMPCVYRNQNSQCAPKDRWHSKFLSSPCPPDTVPSQRQPQEQFFSHPSRDYLCTSSTVGHIFYLFFYTSAHIIYTLICNCPFQVNPFLEILPPFYRAASFFLKAVFYSLQMNHNLTGGYLDDL